jgi:GTP 3',8-cyclase
MGKDQYGRTIDYLRISVTDKCNLRCVYCMPEEGVPFRAHDMMLTLEEIERFVTIAARCGIRHIRLTGGEPLVRKGIVDLVAALAQTPGIESVAMTTNGILLPQMADELKAAGLSRVNISLDTLDATQYRTITRRGEIDEALSGIEKALAVGFDPVKVNAVAVRSLEQDFAGFAELSVARPLHVRFIEYMPVGESTGGHGAGWNEDDVIPSDELCALISDHGEAAGYGRLMPLDGADGEPTGWGPARSYRFPHARGTVGFISARSNHFCSACNRLRLTSDGKLRPCLFSDVEYDVKHALRYGDDAAVQAALDEALGNKPSEHHDRVGTSRKMSDIGG